MSELDLTPAAKAAFTAAYAVDGRALQLSTEAWGEAVRAAVEVLRPQIERAARIEVARELLADARENHGARDEPWDRGFRAGVEHAAHEVANSADRAVGAGT